MNWAGIENVSFLQIQICLNVADLGSFTKAAAAMHISQPAMSKQIANLEESLDIILFIRGKRQNVRPTPAGKILLAKWQEMVQDFTNALSQAETIQSCKARGLVISTTPAANVDTFLMPLLDLFNRRFPHVETRVELSSVTEQKTDLRKGLIDVILSNPFRSELFLSDEISSRMILSCPWSVGMRSSNPLAKKEHISWQDLRTQNFVVPNSQAFIRKLHDNCAAANFNPRIIHMTRFFSGLAANVRSSNEVFLTDRYMNDYGKDGYIYLDMEGTESGILLATRKHEYNSHVSEFLECVEEYIQTVQNK